MFWIAAVPMLPSTWAHASPIRSPNGLSARLLQLGVSAFKSLGTRDEGSSIIVATWAGKGRLPTKGKAPGVKTENGSVGISMLFRSFRAVAALPSVRPSWVRRSSTASLRAAPSLSTSACLMVTPPRHASSDTPTSAPAARLGATSASTSP